MFLQTMIHVKDTLIVYLKKKIDLLAADNMRSMKKQFPSVRRAEQYNIFTYTPESTNSISGGC